MATVTGKTSARIDQIVNALLASISLSADGQLTATTRGGAVVQAGTVGTTLVGATINTAGRLILTRRNGQTVDAGLVRNDVKPLDSYPVGAIYMSISATNPGTIFGGTWVQWGAGRVPTGVASSDTDFSSAEKIGGVKWVSISEAQMPAHVHTIAHQHPMPHKHGPEADGYRFIINSTGGSQNRGDGSAWHATAGTRTSEPTNPNTGNPTTPNSGSTGSGSPLYIMQPYITCYMWKRTA